MKFILSVALFFMTALALVPAASASAEGRGLDLRVFYWPSRGQTDVIDPETGLYRKDHRKPPEITLYIPIREEQILEMKTRYRSEVTSRDYRGGSTLPIYLSKPVVDENNNFPKPHSTLDLSPYSDSVFILMRVDVDTGDVRFVPIPESLLKTPSGSYTIMNMSGQNVGVQFNDSSFMLPSQGTRTVSPEEKKRYDSLKVAIGNAEGVEVISSLSLLRQEASRYLVFVRPDPTARSGLGVNVIPF